ncbi:hypothetical protein PVAP13_3KG484237 [Panicum virgatum]|uniref:Uncharacterized protein n=1 Tax=Panicum virgatum TaxID=38727 RepID=A0A8T0UXA0_PANVG|nr:hypothetical protein PVAP13_3KG484237 [Panicum virgatum]KAG2626878.1 hypothetical protein PVAP13_3KG484237 [Panicum virgatum]KAG2626879.1 hypothetical protein PVAP13_3KG484237 [Panicum virgatum]KAG2626880.1 hypothetical protein PVAP13_3KG484237 [Panicum virgatum]
MPRPSLSSPPRRSLSLPLSLCGHGEAGVEAGSAPAPGGSGAGAPPPGGRPRARRPRARRAEGHGGRIHGAAAGSARHRATAGASSSAARRSPALRPRPAARRAELGRGSTDGAAGGPRAGTDDGALELGRGKVREGRGRGGGGRGRGVVLLLGHGGGRDLPPLLSPAGPRCRSLPCLASRRAAVEVSRSVGLDPHGSMASTSLLAGAAAADGGHDRIQAELRRPLLLPPFPLRARRRGRWSGRAGPTPRWPMPDVREGPYS